MSTNPKEMYVGKPKEEGVTSDARDDTGRLKSSGLNRDRTVKHAVPDDHDFSAAREGLKSGTQHQGTDEDRLKASKAASLGAGQAQFSNQMHVGAKPTQEAVDFDARDDAGRLKSSGMHRDRTDKNAVPDDHDFSALRNMLKKKGPSSGKEADPMPANPTIVPPTPPSQGQELSRHGSQVSIPRSAVSQPHAASRSSRAGTPVEQPSQTPQQQPQEPQQSSVPPSPVNPPSAQKQPSLSRHSSAASKPGSAAVTSPVAVERQGSRTGSVAGSVRDSPQLNGSQPPLSRQGSVQQSVRQTSQPALSRQGSQVSRRSEVQATLPPPSPSAVLQNQPSYSAHTQSYAPTPQVDDELEGVDWKLTTRTLRKEISKLEKKLAKKEEELKTEKADNAAIRQHADQLEERLQQIQRTTSGTVRGDPCQDPCPKLREEVVELRAKVQELGGCVREKERALREVRDTSASRLSLGQQSQHQVEALQREVASLRTVAEQREHLVRQLSVQLESAHEAILSAAQKGFEYDIKLHQARATLVTMLKKERSSPRRQGSASPTSSASPSARPVTQDPYSPVYSPHHLSVAGSPHRHRSAQPTGYQPTIKTPGSPRSLR